MHKFAVIRDAAIVRYVEIDDEERLLPIVVLDDELVEGLEIHGPIVEEMEANRVVYHRYARRALTGRVAILVDGGVTEVRDLGPAPIMVADNVFPYEEQRPGFDPDTEKLDGPTTTVTGDKVVQAWSVARKTAEELSAEAAERGEQALLARFGDAGLTVVFEQENRLRLLEGKDRLSMGEFKALTLTQM